MKFYLTIIYLVFLGINSQGQTQTVANFQWGQDGYTGTQVAELFNTGTSISADNTLGTGFISGATIESLLKFDVSSLKGTYSSIDSISLTLTFEGSSGSGTFNLFEVTPANDAWGLSTNIQPSWFNQIQSSSLPWAGSVGLSTPGVDYVASPLATGTWSGFVTGTLTLTFSGTPSELTALMNSWTSGTNGGLLLNTTAPTSFVGFYGGQNNELAEGNSLLFPKLTVTYETIPEPTTAFLLVTTFFGFFGILHVKKLYLSRRLSFKPTRSGYPR